MQGKRARFGCLKGGCREYRYEARKPVDGLAKEAKGFSRATNLVYREETVINIPILNVDLPVGRVRDTVDTHFELAYTELLCFRTGSGDECFHGDNRTKNV